MHGPRAGLLVCALLGAGACDSLPRPAWEAGDSGGTDAAVFAAVVDTLRGEAESTLLVDTRPIREGVGLFRAEPGVLAERARVLERAGVAETNFDRDDLCRIANGWHHPDGDAMPDSLAAHLQACRARPRFTSAAVGLPVEGGGEGEVVVPAAQVTMRGIVVREFHLRRDPAGRWKVARVEMLMDDRW